VGVTIGNTGPVTARLMARPATLAEARQRLETAIQAARPADPAFAQASVSIVDNQLRVLAGPTDPKELVVFSEGLDPTAERLGLAGGVTLQGRLSGDITFPATDGPLTVTIGAVSANVTLVGANLDTLEHARAELETKVRAANGTPGFAGTRVVAHKDGASERLLVLAGIEGAAVTLAGTAAPNLQLDNASSAAVTALVSGNLSPVPTVPAGSVMAVTLGTVGPQAATTAADASSPADIAAGLQTAIRAAAADATFTGARVAAYSANGENRLVVLAGTAGDAVEVTPGTSDADSFTELMLDSAAAANVQLYTLGGGAVSNSAQSGGDAGDDGAPPDGLALIAGLNDLRKVDLVNLLLLPRTADRSSASALSPAEAGAVIAQALKFCEDRRAFFLMDTPTGIDTPQEVKDYLEANATLRHKNAALYFPRVQVPDPLNDFRLRSVGASGTMAGLYARTDATRGVWKAPAGTDTRLANVQQLDVRLTDDENGTLNPLAINCLRTFPVYGTVSWGARTLEGADQLASEWKYVPVRRLALFLEESLYRGTQWVVFEPNDEPLWAQIRLNLGAFMQGLFRQGAFQGKAPREAYFVKCDRETTTQDDINRGVVNILVGFAPLKPAEFVIIQIQQIAGQLQT
jgi:phage tail sheath protein FI